MSALFKPVEYQSDDWIIDFKNISEPNNHMKHYLFTPNNINSLLKKESKLSENMIKSIIMGNPCDREKLQEIGICSPEMPLNTHFQDILTYFSNIIANKESLWNTYHVSNDGFYERKFHTLVCHMPLIPKSIETTIDLGVIQYSIIYTIFSFHYHNLKYLTRYTDMLAGSLRNESVFNAPENKNIRKYLDLLKESTLDMINSHQKTVDKANINKLSANSFNILKQIRFIHRNICILEKLVQMKYHKVDFCDFHAMKSKESYDFDCIHSSTSEDNPPCNCKLNTLCGKNSIPIMKEINRVSNNILTTLDGTYFFGRIKYPST